MSFTIFMSFLGSLKLVWSKSFAILVAEAECSRGTKQAVLIFAVFNTYNSKAVRSSTSTHSDLQKPFQRDYDMAFGHSIY